MTILRAYAAALAAACIAAAPALSGDSADHSGEWVLDHERSSWSDGDFPPGMRLAITLAFNEDGLVYSSINDTCLVEELAAQFQWCDNPVMRPYRTDYAATFDEAVQPVENQARYNQVSIRRFDDNEFQILKMKDGELILAEFWFFRPDGQELVRRGVSLTAGRAYDEYFVKN